MPAATSPSTTRLTSIRVRGTLQRSTSEETPSAASLRARAGRNVELIDDGYDRVAELGLPTEH